MPVQDDVDPGEGSPPGSGLQPQTDDSPPRHLHSLREETLHEKTTPPKSIVTGAANFGTRADEKSGTRGWAGPRGGVNAGRWDQAVTHCPPAVQEEPSRQADHWDRSPSRSSPRWHGRGGPARSRQTSPDRWRSGGVPRQGG